MSRVDARRGSPRRLIWLTVAVGAFAPLVWLLGIGAAVLSSFLRSRVGVRTDPRRRRSLRYARWIVPFALVLIGVPIYLALTSDVEGFNWFGVYGIMLILVPLIGVVVLILGFVAILLSVNASRAKRDSEES